MILHVKIGFRLSCFELDQEISPHLISMLHLQPVIWNTFSCKASSHLQICVVLLGFVEASATFCDTFFLCFWNRDLVSESTFLEANRATAAFERSLDSGTSRWSKPGWSSTSRWSPTRRWRVELDDASVDEDDPVYRFVFLSQAAYFCIITNKLVLLLNAVMKQSLFAELSWRLGGNSKFLNRNLK